jgi:alanine dehydrogenase
MAAGLGAHVSVFDVSHKRLKFVDDIIHGNITTVYSTQHAIQQAIAHADVLIGAVLVAGARAPVLVTEQMVSHMKPGAVIIDVAIDQGGCVETIRPTTHKDPVYILHDVIHCAVPNIPATVPRTSTYALTNTTLPYIQVIAAKGIKQAASDDDSLAYGINCAKGTLTHSAVAATFRMKWKPWNRVI